GDTWWSGMSTRLSWEGFQKLTADRKAKGFTVVQIVAGLIPSDEELAPSDPGFCNEGGCVWDPQFKQINPKFFDYGDRRVRCLVDSEIVPVIVGAWTQALPQMGVAKMKQHWRYIIARYGAYPVLWVVGGEVYDPPEKPGQKPLAFFGKTIPGGWTEVARYIHATDPYHHPVTVHQAPPNEPPLQDPSLIDFDMFQPSHMGWPSLALEVEQLDVHRSRTTVTKPEVVGEIGYERIGETHLPDFQRMAFWLSMLNGAAGHTYGAVGVWEAYTADKPFQRWKWSFLTWEEGMNFPGSYEVGLGSKLLRQYEWWKFEPHPDWVTPHGTTLLEPIKNIDDFDWGMDESDDSFLVDDFAQPFDGKLPGGAWKAHNGNFRLPYAAGIPGEVRFIYIPCFGLNCETPPTILGLEPGTRYHAYYWEPSLGIKVDLGAVDRPSPTEAIFKDTFAGGEASNWKDYTGQSGRSGGAFSATGDLLSIANGVNESNFITSVDAGSDANAGLILRYHDRDNYLAAMYSAHEKVIYLLDRRKGADGHPLRRTLLEGLSGNVHLTAEVRDGWATMAITDGKNTFTTGIVHVTNGSAGGVGLIHRDDGVTQNFTNFEVRKSLTLIADEHLERKLYDAKGVYRGEMTGPSLGPDSDPFSGGWSDYGKEKLLLLDEYRPPHLPTAGDWVLVLENHK
ncbi:MAG: DUF4038 domain-containing protein, partial [Candidatus Sulfotelmatobacter sp.]